MHDSPIKALALYVFRRDELAAHSYFFGIKNGG